MDVTLLPTHMTTVLAAALTWVDGAARTGAPYIDPGLGSQLIQYLIAGGVALAFVVKLEWKRISHLVRRWFGRGGERPAEDAVED